MWRMYRCNVSLAGLTCIGYLVTSSALVLNNEWLHLASTEKFDAGPAASTGIATYVGTSKLGYVDSAVMLGLSLEQNVPDLPRFCLVPADLSTKSRDLLSAAGWSLVALQDKSGTPTTSGTCVSSTPCSEFYNKMNIFRLPLDRVLWLDADTLVLNSSLRQMLVDTRLPADHVAMVRDCCRPVHNSGVMLLRPNLTTFNTLHRMPMGKKEGDQDLINTLFAGRIVPLDAKFNIHGYKSTACDGAVVAHYTGHRKPTYPDARLLQSVRTGEFARQSKVFPFWCANLYRQYFCSLKNSAHYLSTELQWVLGQFPPCQGA